jgi:hypothetical protein
VWVEDGECGVLSFGVRTFGRCRRCFVVFCVLCFVFAFVCVCVCCICVVVFVLLLCMCMWV